MTFRVFPLVLLSSVPALAVEAPLIEHTPVACMLSGKYPVIEARLLPAGTTAKTARVRFRSDNVPYWSSVAMRAEGNALRGVLLKPSSSSREVYYFIEVSDPAFPTTKTPEYLSQVVSKPNLCPDPRGVATALDSASPVVEKGEGVSVTHPSQSGGGKAKWVVLGALGAGAAGAGIALSGHSTTSSAIPNGAYTGTLDGYVQSGFSTCFVQLNVNPGKITITVSGTSATASFAFGDRFSYGSVTPTCPAPAEPPPLTGQFATLIVIGTSIGGSVNIDSRSFALSGTFDSSNIRGSLQVSGGPVGFSWSASQATFDAAKSQ